MHPFIPSTFLSIPNTDDITKTQTECRASVSLYAVTVAHLVFVTWLLHSCSSSNASASKVERIRKRRLVKPECVTEQRSEW